jgi:hypothetical protein
LLGRRADCGIVKGHWAEETAFRTGVTGTPVFQQGLVGVEEEAGGALALQICRAMNRGRRDRLRVLHAAHFEQPPVPKINSAQRKAGHHQPKRLCAGCVGPERPNVGPALS